MIVSSVLQTLFAVSVRGRKANDLVRDDMSYGTPRQPHYNPDYNDVPDCEKCIASFA